ncbi:phospholipase A2-like [Rattus norvegicus]|uniref:phospholipase A2-like n=1 Tax=Rattus norvegicus TaxID=10116 RepID=UPI00001C9A59|nr:phospholipase A2-like [Rattus norvegicus]
MEYTHYGCFRGIGSSGTPVDDLDSCCQTRDHCCSQAKKLKSCEFLIDNPYDQHILKHKNVITCSDQNIDCENFICNSDRQAGICFSKALYNKEYKDLDTKKFC